MNTNRPTSRLLVTAVGFVAAVASVIAFPAFSSDDEGGSNDESDSLVASSVCEAQELKALKQADPGLRIEIPKDFDTPWPTLEACRSHAAALVEETPGLVQPIPFSHKHHAGQFEIECLYCHSGTDRAPSAGVPSVEVCMGCHSQFPASYDELSGIQTLKEHWEKKQPIEWLQIHRVPE